MYHIPRLSEVIYVGLCCRVGSPTEVRMRREVMDTVEEVRKPAHIMRRLDRIYSGSRREGFRLSTSDVDWMFWHTDHKVIRDPSQISLYHIPRNTLILMECDDLPPGFTRLKLMSQSHQAVLIFSYVVLNNNVYLSSRLFRENHLLLFNISHVPFSVNVNAVPHGPCYTFSFSQDGVEFDSAYCFHSHHWPTSALQWIRRCKQGWPDQNVVTDILNGGFHVVPIGSTPENELEWRISFSRAEQKLVYSMNHCQFLCYGLFKIFLKEVINFQSNASILCSYFIKTIVFWVLQKNTSLSWTPENLLTCFWACFRLLIYMVHTGECPNFFIPQNNMFRVKVNGSVQTSLFSQLYDLYYKGISCLLLSETIRPFLSIALLHRTLRICTDEESIISTTKLDTSLFTELCSYEHGIKRMEDFAVFMKKIQRMIRRRLTPYETVSLQYFASNVLRNTAMFLESRLNQCENRNKVFYKVNKCNLRKQSCKFGYYLSDILYLPIYFYRIRRYEHSLRCLYKAMERMSLPYIMYRDHVNVDVCRHCMGLKTTGPKIRNAIVGYITLYSKYTYIDELVLEQKIRERNDKCFLYIPSLVMLHMLFILNHHILGDTVKSQQSLQDLQTLLLYDDGVCVPTELRDISWQILGICQQICGDYSGSLQSYRYSLQQEPIHKLQEATIIRLNTLPNGVI